MRTFKFQDQETETTQWVIQTANHDVRLDGAGAAWVYRAFPPAPVAVEHSARVHLENDNILVLYYNGLVIQIKMTREQVESVMAFIPGAAMRGLATCALCPAEPFGSGFGRQYFKDKYNVCRWLGL